MDSFFFAFLRISHLLTRLFVTHLDALQILLFFIVSYLLSRVFVKLKLPELMVYWLLEKKHVSIERLTFILITGSALISTVIANVITVLTLMPLVILLQKEIKLDDKVSRRTSTLFLLSLIWGANIGGIGMVTGTATNGVLMGLFDIYKVPRHDAFTFLSWMVWGIPLVIVLAFIGWRILLVVFHPHKYMMVHDLHKQLESVSISRRLQFVGFFLMGGFIIGSAALSYMMSLLPQHHAKVFWTTMLWTVYFIWLIFYTKWHTEESGVKVKLLEWKDTIQGIPTKGVLWILVGALITVVLWQLHFPRWMAHWYTSWLGQNHSILLLYIIFALLTTFASELVSNSGVQVTMFMVLFPLVRHNPDLSWQVMLVITICSTCAFMTPIATPSNGLGFGSSSKVSLKHMMSAGFLMNVACATTVSLWVYYVVPKVINLFSYHIKGQ